MFLETSALLGSFGALLGLQLLKVPQKRSGVLLASLASVFFGFDNFLVAYAGRLMEPADYMSVMFLMIACVAGTGGSVLSLLCPEFHEEAKQFLRRSTKMQMVWTLASGALIALAQTCGCISFSLDEVNSGPNQSVVIANVPIVGLFFYLYSNEALQRKQLIGCCLIVAGVLCMSGVGQGHFESGSFLWICVSTLFYAASIITIRFTADAQLPERPKSLAIVLSSGVLGFLLLRTFLCSRLWIELSLSFLVWPLLNALASMLGLFTVIFSYEVPQVKAALATAIIDSNAVPMCCLNYLLLGELPDFSKMNGMALVLLGCASASAGPNNDAEGFVPLCDA